MFPHIVRVVAFMVVSFITGYQAAHPHNLVAWALVALMWVLVILLWSMAPSSEG